MVLRIQAVMALPTSRSPVVTGLPLLSKATVISFEPLARSARSLTIERMAMHFGADRDAELGLHHVAVHAAAHADDDVAQGLGAEVHDPAHLHPGGVDVEAPHLGQAGAAARRCSCARAACGR